MRSVFILISIVFCTSTVTAVSASFATAADSSFTQSDRDRMIRVETRLEDGLKATNQRIDATNRRIDDMGKRLEEALKATNQRIDDLRELIYVMITVTISGIFILIGFVLWDRRTTIAPVVRTTRELEQRTEKLESAIKEKAESDPVLKEALRHAGLL